MLSLLCLAGAVAVATRWWVRRVDALGRRRPFPAWSAMLLVVLAVALAVPGAQRRIEEHRLASVASRLVGHDVTVDCQTTAAAFVDAGAELGYVRYGADGVPEARTLLKREPCKALRQYLRGGKDAPSEDQVVAVHVLTHEAMHMRGETSEAVAECEAVQRDARTAVMLGASADEGRALAVAYWRAVYPRLPDDYRTGECSPGGPLDEGLDTAPWR